MDFNEHMTMRVVSITEYVEYLLMNPAAYLDHRQKYRSLLEAITAKQKDPLEVAQIAAMSLAEMAEKMFDHIQVSNLLLRMHRDEWKE